jgi:ABC-2 type transport system permease protein
VLTIVSAMMTAISIAREKETGTMEMLLVSPIRPGAIVAGKVIPYIVLGFVSVLLVIAAARTVFGVPLRGSLGLLLAESGLYIITALALGIVISTEAPNQRTAMIAALAGLMMPTLLLSGFIFPLDSLPRPLQWLSHIVPARWFLTIVRGIMLKGAGLATLWQETLVLLGMTLFLLVVGSRKLAIRLG